jgi:hypothetical protein
VSVSNQATAIDRSLAKDDVQQLHFTIENNICSWQDISRLLNHHDFGPLSSAHYEPAQQFLVTWHTLAMTDQ